MAHSSLILPSAELDYWQHFKAESYQHNRAAVAALCKMVRSEFGNLARALADPAYALALKEATSALQKEDFRRIDEKIERLPTPITTGLNNAQVLLGGLKDAYYFKSPEAANVNGKRLNRSALFFDALGKAALPLAPQETQVFAMEEVASAYFDIRRDISVVAEGIARAEATLANAAPGSLPPEAQKGLSAAKAWLQRLAPSLSILDQGMASYKEWLAPSQEQPTPLDAAVQAPTPVIVGGSASLDSLASSVSVETFRTGAYPIDWLPVHRAVRGFQTQMNSLRNHLSGEQARLRAELATTPDDAGLKAYLGALESFQGHYAFAALQKIEEHVTPHATLRDTATAMQYGTYDDGSGNLKAADNASRLAAQMMAAISGPVESTRHREIYADQLDELLAAHLSLRAQAGLLKEASERYHPTVGNRKAAQIITEIDQAVHTLMSQCETHVNAQLQTIADPTPARTLRG